MKKKISKSLLLSLAAFTSTAFAGNLGVTLIQQEHSQWCWAASTQMVLEYLRANPYSQCQMANDSFSISDACGNSTFEWKHKANSTNTEIGIANLLTAGGVSASVKGVLSWTSLKSKIDAGKPFVLGWAWTAGGGHAVVVTGYSSSSNSVYFNDPWPGSGSYTRSYNGTVASSSRRWQGSAVPN